MKQSKIIQITEREIGAETHEQEAPSENEFCSCGCFRHLCIIHNPDPNYGKGPSLNEHLVK